MERFAKWAGNMPKDEQVRWWIVSFFLAISSIVAVFMTPFLPVYIQNWVYYGGLAVFVGAFAVIFLITLAYGGLFKN